LLDHVYVNAGFREAVEIRRNLSEECFRGVIGKFYRVSSRCVELQSAACSQKKGSYCQALQGSCRGRHRRSPTENKPLNEKRCLFQRCLRQMSGTGLSRDSSVELSLGSKSGEDFAASLASHECNER